MNFLDKVRLGLENKFKTGELDPDREDFYITRAQKEFEIIIKTDLIKKFLLACEVSEIIAKTGIKVKWEACFIPASLIAYSLGIVKEDPVKKGRLFELYVNPERVCVPELVLKIGEKGRLKLISELNNEFSLSKIPEKIKCDFSIGKPSNFIISRNILAEKYKTGENDEDSEDIILALFHSELFSFIEKNMDKTLLMPDLYHEILSGTNGELLYHDQLVRFLSEYFRVSLPKADLLRRALMRLANNSININYIFKNFSFLNDVKDKNRTKYVLLKLSEEVHHLKYL
ncbi:MAG: hypothetical protein ACOX2F_09930 [bacterium]